MVAAYLVGTRGTSRDALALGLDGDGHAHARRLRARARDARAVGVRAARGPLPVAQPRLGAAGRRRGRERAALAAARAPARGGGRASHDHGHAHARTTTATRTRTTTRTITTTPTATARRRHHSHDVPDRLTPRALIAMGASAGLLPCPSALVVLLGAISQHQVGLGLVLIIAFSAGSRGDAHRARDRRRARGPADGARRHERPRLHGAAGALRALILCVGLGLTLQALPTL